MLVHQRWQHDNGMPRESPRCSRRLYRPGPLVHLNFVIITCNTYKHVVVCLLQVAANGSVQDMDIPEHLKALYKTVWEIKQRVLVDMAADRCVRRGQARVEQACALHRDVGTLLNQGDNAWGNRDTCFQALGPTRWR